MQKSNLAKFHLLALAFASCGVGNADQGIGDSGYQLNAVPFHAVTLNDLFWSPRLVSEREVLIPHALDQTQVGLADLQAAADFLAGKSHGRDRGERYRTSDLYKVLEAIAYLLHQERDPALERRVDEIAGVIAAAQESDGYLYPAHTMKLGHTAREVMGDKPYSFVVHSHELYNMGHLYEAAVAYYQATSKDNLLKISEKHAQHVNRVFFEGDPKYNDGKPVMQADGHEEIELALVKLFRVTGKQQYLDMARKFLEIRGVTYRPDGEGVMAPQYAQQHLPVGEQREPAGHAVRAMYLYSAMADVSALSGDQDYSEALKSIWQNMVDTRMHITGGLGAVRGIEGFGPPYELPNRDTYDETCAGVGNVLFNYRMFLLTKDAKYLDVGEVALFNNVLAGTNFAGNRFFYVNPLDSDGQTPFNHGTAGRAPWFGTACCPTNIARLLPQVQGMAYAHAENDLYVTYFMSSSATVKLDGGEVNISQETSYPNGGTVKLNIAVDNPLRFRLLVRVPTWTTERFLPGKLYPYADKSSQAIELRVNGSVVPATIEQGFAVVEREWHNGDTVELRLPMSVRMVKCDPAVLANRERVAFTRGPLVLCAEGMDNDGLTQRIFVETDPTESETQIAGQAIGANRFINVRFPAAAVDETNQVQLSLIPYYAWNNRGVSSMTVWFPTNRELATADFLEVSKSVPQAQ